MRPTKRTEGDSAAVTPRTRTGDAKRPGRPWRQTVVGLAVVVALAVGLAFVPASPAAAAGGAGFDATTTDAATPTAAESSLVVADATVESGETATHRIALTETPDGLAGFEVTLELSNDAASVSDAGYPDAYEMTTDPVVSNDGRSVTVEAADLTDEVTPGASDVTLATVDVTGTDPGSTTLEVTDLQVDADGGSRIDPALEAGTLTVDNETSTRDGDDDDGTESGDSVPGFATGAALVAIAVFVTALIARDH